jgi:hypothetical protein
VAPARRYDHLDVDFNRAFLVLGLVGMAAGTYALGILAERKERGVAWR